MDIPFDTLIIIAIMFLMAGTIKGLIGIGLPTIAISMMSLIIDARLAITLTIIPMFISNLWQVYRSGEIWETFQKYRVFSALLIISILISALSSKTIPSNFILIILGTVITVYAILSLLKWTPHISERYDIHAQAGFGMIAGILGGFTAIWAPPMIIYLTSRQTPKEDFIRATGMLITIGSIPLLIGYIQNGLLTKDIALSATFMIIPVLIGFAIGEHLRRYVSAQKFLKIVLCIFTIMGINLIYRGFVS